MDLEEWDLLSDEGFIDLHENRVNSVSPKSIPNTTTTTLIDMNYFQPRKRPGLIPVPIQLGHQDEKIGEKIPEEEVIKFPIETTKTDTDTDTDSNQQIIKEADHQETVSQVSFKKLKENEFVDMKMDSPKSINRGLLPQIDVGAYQFEEKLKGEDEKQIPINKKDEKISRNSIMDEVSGNWNDGNNEGLNVWKWAMTGIGALFSFGFAAATVSIIVLGNRHKESCNNSKKQELQFQIYSNDKRLKQVVRHATKLNDAITAMRGAPVTQAHITIGGYHESL
ncbi:ATG8-interacting protein 1 [Bienertia sinuspersici]